MIYIRYNHTHQIWHHILFIQRTRYSPSLSWRDVQHLLAWTCQVAPLQHNPEGTWIKNGAGFYVSHDFGFGMLNVNELVEKAKEFQSVGPMNTCVTRAVLNE